MTAESHKGVNWRFERIVLTLSLGGDENQRPAMEHAAHFAREFGTEITCLFVRDMDLLHYAALPFAREFSLHSAQSRALEIGDVRKEMDRRASSLRRVMDDLAANQQQRSTYHVVDGRLDEKAMESARDNDILAITHIPPERNVAGNSREIVRRVLKQARCDLLLLPQARHTSQGPIIVVSTDAPPSERALLLAAHIATKKHADMEVVYSDENTSAKSIHALCDTLLMANNAPVPNYTVKPMSGYLSAPWRNTTCSLAIMDIEENIPTPDFLDQSLSLFQAPFLLLRRKNTKQL